MDRFSIDQVRDSFSSDIAEKLAQIQQAGRAILEAPAFSLPASPRDDHLPVFEAAGQSCHAIHGTSSLVSVNSLAESARLLERVAQVGTECVREMGRRIRLSRLAAEVCLEGAGAMGRMLELELRHETAEAEDLARHLRERVDRWQEERRALETEALVPPVRVIRPAESPSSEFSFEDEAGPGDITEQETLRRMDATPPQEFSFEDEGPSLAAVGAPGPSAAEFSFEERPPSAGAEPAETPLTPAEALATELLEVFRQEARESLVALQGYLRTLGANGRDREAAQSLERIYHTLKGASATVGLFGVSGMAAELQDAVERAIEREGVVRAPLIKDLVARTNRLLLASGLPRIHVEIREGAEPEQSEDLQRLFLEEAAVVVREAQGSLSGDPGVDAFTRFELGKLFHRLKGSAILAGAGAVAERSAALQQVTESRKDGSVLRDEITAGLIGLRSALDALGQPSVSVPESSPDAAARAVREEVRLTADPELWEAFEIEVSDVTGAVERGILALEESAQPKAIIEDLYRHFHTLKGAVNTAGITPLGRVIHRLEDFLEGLATAPILPPLHNLATLLLRVLEGVRRGVQDAHKGFVEINLAEVEAEIAVVQAGGGRRWSDRSDVPTAAGARPSRTADSRGSLPAPSSQEAIERKFVRVATDRLDGLMNITGELVVGRSRLVRRVATLRGLQRQLGLGRNRLLGAVERFRERYEFAVGEGRRRPVLAAGGSAGIALAGFGDLEMDRYGDVNILARTLHDITSGIAEVQKQIDEGFGQFSDDAGALSAMVSALQGEVTRARMVPVDQLFLRLRLPVRDAAYREGKSVRVTTFGEQVDLDKTIIDKLYVPMLHLVRNCVAHGIEEPERRRLSGKDPVGTVTLSARQEASQIVVEVTDDGAGLDLARLHQAAVQAGVISAETPADHPSVQDSIFLPGVSTRGEADDVSGRGMGGDVVRREIEKLNGEIHVRSEPGRGTTFVITLPLTLAIARALLVRHRGQVYALPLGFAERIVDVSDLKVHESAGVRRIQVEGSYLALKDLDTLLELPSRADGPPAGTKGLVLRAGEQRVTVEVDQVLGQEEIVVKSLGDVLAGHPLLSGVTVGGDGDLILILDVPGLLELGARTTVMERPAPAPVAPRPVRPAGAVEPRSGPLRVLFVDDSLSVRKVAERFLRTLGTEVLLAIDGQDALERLGAGGFDLVFTDLEMPRMHGYELIRRMRETPALQSVPVVVVTSRSGQKHREQAQAVGAQDYLTKPFTQDVLQQMLGKWGGRLDSN